MKDAAQEVALGVAQHFEEDASGAAEDGRVKVFILTIVIFQRRNTRPTHACRPLFILVFEDSSGATIPGLRLFHLVRVLAFSRKFQNCA